MHADQKQLRILLTGVPIGLGSDKVVKILEQCGANVVDLTWQACHTYIIESFHVSKMVQDDFGLPFLHIEIETDYSESDTEQLRVRIQAFIEMI